MMLRWIDSDGVSNHDVAELAGLRKRTDGFGHVCGCGV
jgi:hypothetical protein